MARFVRVVHDDTVSSKVTEEVEEDTLDQDTMRRIAKAVASATNYDVNVDELTFVLPEDIIRFSKNENKAVLISSMLKKFEDTDAANWKVADMKKLLLLSNVSTTGVCERSHIVELVTNLLPKAPAPPTKSSSPPPSPNPPHPPPPTPEKTIRKKATSIIRDAYNLRKR